MAAWKLASVFSGYAAEACMNNVRRAGRCRAGSHSLHHGDPNTLALGNMGLAHVETWGW